MSNKPLYLLVGKSASGKTTIANILESEYGLSQLQSYTTRPKRYENETGHIFITDKEFDNLNNIIAFTEYNGYRYCATKEQIDAADIYVIDVPGVKTLMEKYHTDRQIIVLYFDTSIRTRIERMLDRESSDAEIVSRLYHDEKDDWMRNLSDILHEYINGLMYLIDANNSIKDVLLDIEFYTNIQSKE